MNACGWRMAYEMRKITCTDKYTGLYSVTALPLPPLSPATRIVQLYLHVENICFCFVYY